MELQQQQGIEDNGKTNNSISNFSSRQSSTRWTPTTDQIRILKDLYYNNGVRSPTAEQIQRISAKLRQYGKIEGKNVFYWFQNHKARERQRKRFSTPAVDHHMMPMHNNSIIRRKDDDDDDHLLNVYNGNKFPSMNPGAFPSSAASVSAGFVSVGSYNNKYFGSVAMERSFREYCSVTPNGAATYNSGGSMGNNIAWIGNTHADNPHYSSATQYPFLENARKYNVNNGVVDHQTLESLEEDEEAPGTETLPLFPIYGDNLKKERRDYYYFNVWQRSEDSVSDASRASLELTLNSYSANEVQPHHKYVRE